MHFDCSGIHQYRSLQQQNENSMKHVSKSLGIRHWRALVLTIGTVMRMQKIIKNLIGQTRKNMRAACVTCT